MENTDKSSENTKKIKNLVLSGGSSKGFSYIGVIKALEENDLIKDIEEIACASIGSIFGLFIILGFSSSDLLTLLLKIDLNLVSNIDSESIINLVNDFGLDSGYNVETIMSLMIENYITHKKPSTVTFLDLWQHKNIKFNIVGSKLYDGYVEEIIYNHIKTPNLEVIKAIRVSISIPPIFKPIDGLDHHLMDGGIVNNYPINLYKNQLDTTLGILCLTKHTKNKCSNIYEVYSSIINHLAIKSSLDKKDTYADYTITIESNVSPFKILDITNETKLYLVNLGYQLTRQFIDIKHYGKRNIDYVSKTHPNIDKLLNKILLCLNRTPLHKAPTKKL
uniref:PNPLA domain-containing protein n=1 Tax=viral metagenome TaxID=1070528 RepID=A0A6C0E611_9ZZZZ